jgi:1-acyl-sn-glycerol-3-phosphate acyltransferase
MGPHLFPYGTSFSRHALRFWLDIFLRQKAQIFKVSGGRTNPFWKVDVHGFEFIDKRLTYVIVANHQSIADIIILYQIRMQYKWVAKDSLFRIPFLGWCMHLAKHIKLVRGSSTSILHIYRKSGTWLKDVMSVICFPEGTRSKTGSEGTGWHQNV